MKSLLLTLAIVLFASAAFAQPFYVAGDFDGWNAEDNEMFDDGTNGDAVAGDGIHSLLMTIADVGRHEFKIAEFAWANSWPVSGNGWFVTTVADEGVLFTFNTNTVGDGWLPDGYWPFTDHSGAYTLVGDLQDELGDAADWDPTGNLILHDDGINGDAVAGDGYFTLAGVMPAGTWSWKIVQAGAWDSIGSDGVSVNSGNNTLELTEETLIYFVLDMNLGRFIAAPDVVATEDASWSDLKSMYR